MRLWRACAWGPMLAWALAGCPGSLENPDRFLSGNNSSPTDGGSGDDGGPTGFTCMADSSIDPLTDILTANTCASIGCHGMGSMNGEFKGDLSDLVNADSRADGKCMGSKKYIDKDNTAESLILTVISTSPPCGLSRMPQGGTLSDPQISCIKEYIEDLATR